MFNVRLLSRKPFSWRRGVVNIGVVNGGAFFYLPAAKNQIFRVFAPKSAFQKVR
jgi:hypothetical protein